MNDNQGKNTKFGRPKIADEIKRTDHIKVLVTKAEKEQLKRTAEKDGVNLSVWIRMLALEKARDPVKENTPIISTQIGIPMSDIIIGGGGKFSAQLKEIRINTGITLRAAAGAIGLPASIYIGLENNELTTNESNWHIIIEKLNQSSAKISDQESEQAPTLWRAQQTM